MRQGFRLSFMLTLAFALTLTAGRVGAKVTSPEARGGTAPTSGGQSDEADSIADVAEEGAAPIVYVPPPLGAPSGRIGGGARATQEAFPRLEALAPDHVGLTIQAQPTLYWYLSDRSERRIDVTLIDEASPKPLLEITIDAAVEPGIHAFRLRDHGVSLEAGETYRWYVALVPDPMRRSSDVIVGGAIERRTPTEELRKDLAGFPPGRVAHAYARNGCWYDALDALSQRIDAKPDEPGLRAERFRLLGQVGLKEIAAR